MDLTDVRAHIDAIDDKITELYVERMKLCKEVGVIKAQTKKAVHDGKREKDIVYRLSQSVPEDLRLYLKELYDTVFYTSKAYQSKFTNLSSPVKEEIEKIIEG